jgi:hypothetical protein
MSAIHLAHGVQDVDVESAPQETVEIVTEHTEVPALFPSGLLWNVRAQGHYRASCLAMRQTACYDV